MALCKCLWCDFSHCMDSVCCLCSYLKSKVYAMGIGRFPYDHPLTYFSYLFTMDSCLKSRYNQKRTLISSHHLLIFVCLPTFVPICSAFLCIVAMCRWSLLLYKAKFLLCSRCHLFCLFREITCSSLLSSQLAFSSLLGHHISICWSLSPPVGW